MKKYTLILISCLVVQFSFGQTTAKNWVKNDCRSGEEISLYNMLDQGYVVIQEYVMMNCTPCITAGKGLKNISDIYAGSHPGRVKVFQTVFENSTNCDKMNSWATENQFTYSSLFTHGSDEIDYYGGFGMPSVLVFGGKDHKIYYNNLGYAPSDKAKIVEAIDKALSESTIATDELSVNNLMISPNPIGINASIQAEKAVRQVDIYNAYGSKINTAYMNERNPSIDMSAVSPGVYYIKVTFEDNKIGYKKVVKD